MKTSVIGVHDMLSVLSVDEVERRIGKVPGVESVTVNYSAGDATVRYDETRLEIRDIKSTVRQNGYEAAAPAATSEGDHHESQPAPSASPATAPKTPAAPPPPSSGAAPTAPMSMPPKKPEPVATASPAGDGQKDKVKS